VANSVFGVGAPARAAERYSVAAHAMATPSYVAVPRPTSSRMTSESSLAALRIRESSSISTMNVERPSASSSKAPTRV